MAMQQTNSSFAKKLGGRVAQANTENKDKPIDTGTRRLPGGIKVGVAKLQFMYTKEQDKDDGVCPKGEHFLRASAVVLGQIINGVLVKDHKGENIENMTTAQIVPICDVPEKVYPGGGKRDEVTLSQNWFKFQNLFKLLSNGSIVCQETVTYDKQGNITNNTDPTGEKTQAFYFSAMAALTNPKHPIYVEFSTEVYKSKKRPNETDDQYATREPFVTEKWHGIAKLPAGALKQHDPAAGMTEGPARSHPMDPPPLPPQTQTSPARAAAPLPTDGPPPQHQPDSNEPQNEELEVAGMVEVCLADPEITTSDSSAASQQLEEMAWKRGWTKEKTGAAKDWAEVGFMALHDSTPQNQLQIAPWPVVVGSKWMYAKRTKEGVKYKDNKGVEFPTQECEVVTANVEEKTCTLKTCHDGKDVTDIRTKKLVDVKFDWLENAPPY